MYVINNAVAFNNACSATERTISVKVEVVANSITMTGSGANGEIVSFEWDNIVCSEEGFQIGTACSDEFVFVYRVKSTTIDLMGKEIIPYIGIEVSGSDVFIPLGHFWVTNTETNDDGNTITVTAHDGMSKFVGNIDFSLIGITFPTTAWAIIEAICTYKGVTLIYSPEMLTLKSSDNRLLKESTSKYLIVYPDISENRFEPVDEPSAGTYRDYIAWASGLIGGYAHFDRNGNLVIKAFAGTGFSVTRDVQYLNGAKINFGGSVTYTAIVSGTEEAPIYSSSYTGNAITYENPYMTTELLERICDEIIGAGLTITPCEVRWRGNPCVDAGDIISVADRNGNATTVYVMEQRISVHGGMSTETFCYGETEVYNSLTVSPLATKLERINQSIEDAKKEASDAINITKGTFEFIPNGEGGNAGFTIYEEEGISFLRCTSGGIGISQDGGLTYTNAITKYGIVASELSVKENGVEVMYAGAEPDSVELSVKNPTTGNYVMRLKSWTDEDDEPSLSYLLRDPMVNENVFTLDASRMYYTSTTYEDYVDVRYINPYNTRNAFRLYSSVNSSNPNNPYTEVEFGSDINGTGMIKAYASAGYLRVQKRSGTRVYFTDYGYDGTIDIGYENDDGTGSSRTVTL